ncbi:conserved hypothetical protein [Leishmania infantum JPCM5]|uniref:Uncharacterized protein n=2 Tax=Leishmania infantum TaxID=5671 RepID=A4HRD3_LEIIN|nr:conserved hypothetical protein [Leishmania infantum JPCM5]CAC9436435.1 hypothetical_protein_-_conserved [Leishmania infantum]CAM65163.1 conserved hypothetical protein [Leishmania infantum JPCM5]SUZ38550.1 hypothetical_protein_-_conserved [Leishmania infantum]|eukprot:XP_001462625.1 conserved hypothetical protein [Leishmania infantum JPCM5]
MHFDPGPCSRDQRPQRENRYTVHYNMDGRAAPSSTTTLLPLRHYGRARDISAMLTAPVVEYRQPQWTTPLGKPLWTLSPIPNPTTAATGVERRSGGSRSGTPHAYCIPSSCPTAFTAARTLSYLSGAAASAARATETTLRSSSNVMRQPFTSSYMEVSPPSAAVAAQRDYEAAGRRVRAERAGGATATAGRHSSGSSPPPRSTTSDQQSHRSRDIAQARPGCTTSTERVRYRNGVTRKLIDLYDEIAELYDCRENMRNQVTQAMRTDPRYCKERHGEVRLACEPTPQQQSAVESVEDALEVLHDAVHELVAAYLTPEEKRHLGIDTHLFQTSTEKANTYQYAPPPSKPQSSSSSAARRARRKTSTATTSPLPSTRPREVRKEQEEGEADENTAATSPTPAAPTLTAPADTPAPQQQPLATTTTNNNISNNVWDLSAPAASAAFSSAAIPLPAFPVKLAQQSVVELSQLADPPQPVTSSSQPLCSSIVHVAAPEKHEDGSDTAVEQKPATASHTEDAEIAEGTPERVLASAVPASTPSITWPTDTGAGSTPHPPTGSQPPLATDQLVKVPVSSPDAQIPIAKTPPAVPPGPTSVRAQAREPALTSTNPTQPPPHPPSQAAFATSCNDASAAKASEPQAQRAVSRFKRLLIDSDSDSSW